MSLSSDDDSELIPSNTLLLNAIASKVVTTAYLYPVQGLFSLSVQIGCHSYREEELCNEIQCLVKLWELRSDRALAQSWDGNSEASLEKNMEALKVKSQ
jgi:hypothetical protein